MTDGQKKVVLQAGLAFACGVVMILIGYYLNEFIARDRLAIEYVELIPEYETYDVPDDAYQALNTNSYFQRRAYKLWLGESAGLLSRSLHPWEFSHVCGILTEFNQNASKAHDKVSSLIKNAEANLSEDILNAIKKYLTIHTSYSESFQTENGEADQPHALDRLKREYQLIVIAIEASRSIIDGLNAVTKPTRTGDLQIAVTVINRGPTDGLLRKNGIIVVPAHPGSRVPIYGAVTKIERRSIKTVRYKVDWDRCDPANRDLLKSLLKNKSGRVKIVLHDIRQNKITSSVTPLPVSDSWGLDTWQVLDAMSNETDLNSRYTAMSRVDPGN